MKLGRNLSLPDLALIRDAIYPQALAIDVVVNLCWCLRLAHTQSKH